MPSAYCSVQVNSIIGGEIFLMHTERSCIHRIGNGIIYCYSRICIPIYWGTSICWRRTKSLCLPMASQEDNDDDGASDDIMYVSACKWYRQTDSLRWRVMNIQTIFDVCFVRLDCSCARLCWRLRRLRYKMNGDAPHVLNGSILRKLRFTKHLYLRLKQMSWLIFKNSYYLKHSM